MKTAVFLFALVSTALLCRATLPQPWVAGTGQFRSELLEVWVDPGAIREPRWNPEKDEWPISMTRAIELSRTALQRIVGDSQRYFGCQKASLCRFFSSPSTEKASWYFLVVFESAHESLITKTQGEGYAPAIFPFVVFPDGRVVTPEKKVRMAPAEPPHKAITAPADQESRRPKE